MTNIRIGIIGGSGLGDALGVDTSNCTTTSGGDTPFGKPSAPLLATQWHGVDLVICQRHGIGHVFNPSQVPYRANIYALKSLGVTHIIASGAVGSLRENIHPGELAVVDQVIDKTYKRANTFFDHAAVHTELAEPFCPVMRQWLLAAAGRMSASGGGVHVHDRATYICMEGPQFSTKAESNMHRALGGDLIGMTVMPEAKLAREAEIAYALIALPTDYDCWRPHTPGQSQQQLLSEIIGNLNMATDRAITLMRTALEDVSMLRDQPSPAHNALKLAIWSDKSKIDPVDVKRLKVLWGAYF